MWSMYNNKMANVIIAGISLILLVLFSVLLRRQTAISE